MKIKLELFGASRDFSDKDHLEFEIEDKSSVNDLRNEIIKYIDINFGGNKNFIQKFFIIITCFILCIIGYNLCHKSIIIIFTF